MTMSLLGYSSRASKGKLHFRYSLRDGCDVLFSAHSPHQSACVEVSRPYVPIFVANRAFNSYEVS